MKQFLNACRIGTALGISLIVAVDRSEAKGDPLRDAVNAATQRSSTEEYSDSGKAAHDCIESLRARLKDPDSLKVYGSKTQMAKDGKHVTVIIDYSATNSFGARTRSRATCN